MWNKLRTWDHVFQVFQVHQSHVGSPCSNHVVFECATDMCYNTTASPCRGLFVQMWVNSHRCSWATSSWAFTCFCEWLQRSSNIYGLSVFTHISSISFLIQPHFHMIGCDWISVWSDFILIWFLSHSYLIWSDLTSSHLIFPPWCVMS